MIRSLDDINTTPTKGMVDEAIKGLEWRKEFGRGGTEVGVARARDIKNKKDLSIRTIKRMFSFFSRHEVDKKAEGFRPGEKGYPSNGRIAWALWGGDSGFSWSKKKMKEIKREENNMSNNNDFRNKVGTMITDGIELPLFDTIEEAESEAKKLGGSGHHQHTLDGKVYYMPFENHIQALEIMEKINMNEHYPGHEQEDKSEVRSITNKETRFFKIDNFEIRSEGDEKRVIGYGAVFNTLSNDLGGFTERIDPKAFDGRTDDDVRFLLNHDPNFIYGRTTAGTLRLSIDEKGLRYEVDMPDTQSARDLEVSLERGDINQSSFAFTVEEDSWDQSDNGVIRTINKVSRLYDVSAVTYPAYEEASVALRSLEQWKEEAQENKLKENLEKEISENQKELQDLHKRNLAELKLKLIK